MTVSAMDPVDEHIEDQEHSSDHRHQQEPEAESDVARGRRDQVGFHPATKHETVERNRTDDARGRQCRRHERAQVDVPLEGGDLGEPAREREREQEGEQDLYPGLKHPHLLQQLTVLAVEPLGLGLVAPGGAGRAVSIQMPCTD